jgi:DNA-3-methyladenine glycosylase
LCRRKCDSEAGNYNQGKQATNHIPPKIDEKRELRMPDKNFLAKLQKPKLLDPAFYNRDPREVASDLLGKVLLRREGRNSRAGRIVELEAYLGNADPAAHAFVGKTKRNEVLFGPPGRAYVYFIYGFHYCLNVSCEPEGKAGCLLIRALEPLSGIEQMFAARDLDLVERRLRELRLLTSGPGRLAEAFSITRERDNGKDVTSQKSDLQIVDDGFSVENVAVTKRIGIKKAAHELLRYSIDGNPFVSGTKSFNTAKVFNERSG